MKNLLCIALATYTMSVSACPTTIDNNHKSAYGANIAWLNFQGDGANGAVVTEDILAGHVWSANCAWINLGDGSPDSGPHYQNNSATDYGVNLDPVGNLSGFAWGANIGWLNFHPFGQPKIDLLTGKFSGYIWSANCGWISLSNEFAYVQTTVIQRGADMDKDGLPDSWELRFARTLDVLDPKGDPDGDGLSNYQEALANTNPFDPSDALRITHLSRNERGGFDLKWQSQPTRLYRVSGASALGTPTSWQDLLGLISPGPNNETAVQLPDSGSPQSYFRVEAVKPLSP